MENLHALVHNVLPHGDSIDPLAENEMACLEEIRDILVKHNKLDRFGITLLHKHFDIADDEILIENVDEDKRQQIIQPMKKSEVAQMGGEILETCWSLQLGDVVQGCRRACVKQDNSHYPGVHVWTGN